MKADFDIANDDIWVDFNNRDVKTRIHDCNNDIKSKKLDIKNFEIDIHAHINVYDRKNKNHKKNKRNLFFYTKIDFVNAEINIQIRIESWKIEKHEMWNRMLMINSFVKIWNNDFVFWFVNIVDKNINRNSIECQIYCQIKC